MNTVIYEKFGAVLQMQHPAYCAAPAVLSEVCCLWPKQLKLQDSV